MAYHTTPSLGMDLNAKQATKGYWDTNSSTPTPALGTHVFGSDGHDYVAVKSAATHAAGARLDVNDTTWAVAANVAGLWMVPSDLTGGVVANDVFWARRFGLI